MSFSIVVHTLLGPLCFCIVKAGIMMLDRGGLLAGVTVLDGPVYVL